MDDPYLWHRNHDIAVEVTSDGDYAGLTPLLEELSRHFGDIRTRRVIGRPETGSTTAPDWDFIASVALTLTALGGVDFVRRILGSLAEDSYRALRRKLLRTRRRRLDLRRIRRGLVITIGSHRFVFDQSIQDAEFRRQLWAAQRLVERSPSALLEHEDALNEWTPWIWDKDQERWRTSGVLLAHALGEEPIESRPPF